MNGSITKQLHLESNLVSPPLGIIIEYHCTQLLGKAYKFSTIKIKPYRRRE
jgi:hypothetical protein